MVRIKTVITSFLSIGLLAVNSWGQTPATPATGANAATLDALLQTEAELVQISETRADERVALLQKFITRYAHSPLVVPAREALLRARAAVAENSLKQQRITTAVAEFQTALQEAPRPVGERVFNSFLLVFPTTLFSYGYREEALGLMRQLEQEQQTNASRLAQIGNFYLTAEAGEDAARVLTQAVKLADNEAKYYSSLARARVMQLDLAAAKAAYQQAIERDPQTPTAYAGLATLYRSTGLWEDAIALYQKQLAVTPEHDSAHGQLAVTYLLMKQPEAAIAPLTRHLAIAPRDWQLLTQLAYTAALQQDYTQARRWVELALTIAPTYTWARLVLANNLIRQQDFITAEELLADTRARGSAFFTIYWESSRALLLAENYEGAFEQLEKLVKVRNDGSFEVQGVIVEQLKPVLEKELQVGLGLPQTLITANEYQLLENFLRFRAQLPSSSESTATEANTMNRRKKMERQVQLLEALQKMLAVQDERTPFRALWAAEELLTHDIALERAGDLAIAALAQSRLATEREGSIRERPELAATDRQKWFQARAYYLLGKLRLRQEQNPQAAQYFQLAIDNFPASAEQRAAASYLATTLQAMGQETEALALYLKNYNPYDQNAAVQRTLIQNLYRKIHGSLEGLQLK